MPREEEEFELILGNKQLLSLFFLVVVLFAVFFSFGYTVGYGRGETSRTREVAAAEPVEEPSRKVQLPETLLEDAPKTPTRPPQQETPPPAVAKTAPAKDTPKPSPVVQETKKADPPPVPRTTAAAPTPAPAAAPPSSSAVTESTHLQISAVRVKEDAEAFVQQLRGQGHPAAVSDRGDGWFRIVVGPFDSDAAALAYQKRLRQDGVDSLLRRR